MVLSGTEISIKYFLNCKIIFFYHFNVVLLNWRLIRFLPCIFVKNGMVLPCFFVKIVVFLPCIFVKSTLISPVKMYLPRNIDKELAAWRQEKEGKPLLLRGARQVG